MSWLNNGAILNTVFDSMNRPDFAAIDAFTKVAEEGSFRAAARALGAPVSTVSVQVSRLEERLGIRLLSRTTRSVSLTDEGRSYFERVRVALGAIQEAESALDPSRSRPLRLAAPVELGQAVLGKVVRDYAQAHGDSAIEVLLTSSRVDPIHDGFDLVLQSEPADSTSLVAKKLGSPIRYQLAASRGYLDLHGRPRHPRELQAHACLVMGLRQTCSTWRFSHAPAVVHRHATANTWQLVHDFALADCGIARLPEYLTAPAVAAGTLELVLDAFTPPPERLYAVYAKNRYVPARISAFVAVLQGFLAVWPGCLAQPRSRRPKHQA